jgi:hypothetical protein
VGAQFWFQLVKTELVPGLLFGTGTQTRTRLPEKTNWTWEPDSLFHLYVELELRFLGKKIEKKRDYIIEPRTKGEETNQKLTTNSSLGYLEQGLIFRTGTKTKPG